MEKRTKETPPESQRPQPPRQRLRLPFEPRTKDPGTWSYDHRVGICVTIIVYLLFAICFVWAKIGLGDKKGEGVILVDVPEQNRETPLTPEQIERLEAMMREDFSNVRNLSSNENAELNDRLRDAKGINASDLYDEAGSLDDRMRANREAYEAGMRQVEQMRAPRGRSDGGETAQDSRVKGNVTVSYSFTDPVRTKVNLVVPAYMCEGGGQVTVVATLDHNGFVTSATVERGASVSDNCMQSTAVRAALASRFNVDTSAPAKHRGTITYIFIPQ